MRVTRHGFSISMRTAANYRKAIQCLRAALARHGFEILLEFPLLHEVERKTGLPWSQLGMSWKNYTILSVWSPSDAGPALLSDHDGGLLLPFNLWVAEREDATFILAASYIGTFESGSVSLGTQALARNQINRIRTVFSEIPGEKSIANAVGSLVRMETNDNLSL